MATIYKPIITRIDTTANWTTLNPVPAKGEQCIEILGGGLFKLKIGDGVSPWIALNYYSGSNGSAEDLSKLITPDKSSLVAAINSVQAQLNALVARITSLSNVAFTGDYNDLINKLIAGENITIDENNVISANGTPPTPTPIDEYDPTTEGLEIHQIIIISDETGDLVLDGVNGEIIPIYDEEPDHEVDIDGNIIFFGNIQVISDTDGDLVLENVDGKIIPIYDEDGHETDIDGDLIYNGDIYVVSDTDGDLVLGNVDGEIIPIYDEDGHETDIDGDLVYNGDIYIASDIDGDLVLENVDGEIIPIYDEDGHETDIDGDLVYDGDIQIVSDTGGDLVLTNTDGEIIPIYDDESGQETDIDGDITYDSNIQVVSDTDEVLVLNNVNDAIIPLEY